MILTIGLAYSATQRPFSGRELREYSCDWLSQLEGHQALSSPYGDLGMPLTGTVWVGIARVLSLLPDAGWS
ncbi:hypothetical protein ACFYWN_30100 [Streptomyces sp. NPDC002917]|uniref:hypothetical protein n=1 Tax=Streptomyces sp. NPDC002917 TaxID=3364671 RepID=UPI00367B8E4B